MSRRSRDDFKGSLIIPVGWLFADLLLALAMLFLVANTVPPKVDTTPTPAVVTPDPVPDPISDPTPTPLPSLNTVSYDLCLTVDYKGLLADPQDPSAVKGVKDQVQSDTFLKKSGRRAGLVIPYGGAPDQNNEGTGLQVADKVVAILQSLGATSGFVFNGTVYHGSVHYLQQDYSFVKLEIYLYTQPDFKTPPPGNCKGL